MKRVLITLLTILIAGPLIFGGVLGVSYYNTGADSVPLPSLVVNGQSFAPTTYEWHQPVFNGMLFKEFSSAAAMPASLGVLLGEPLQATPPLGYASTASLLKDGAAVWSGEAADVGSYVFTEPGSYQLDVKSEKAAEKKNAYGTFYYNLTFAVDIEPEMAVSATSVQQGDVLAIRVSHLFGGLVPTAESNLENLTVPLTFLPEPDGSMVAFVPVMHNREAGGYTITVAAGEKQWEISFEVVPGEFPRQDLIIDTTDETVSEASSPAAYQQFRDKIYPFYETADPEIYWSGAFTQPTVGRISTEYGLFRYTNGSTTPSRHSGIDIAAAEGTAVLAPAVGRVVFAEYLLNTGNTIVIEHGGGLKSYFFHMNSLEVEAGQMVGQGQPLGTVGTTGYSTGPHLHYEVRIGNQTINPMLLFSGESGLFYFDGETSGT